MFSKRVLIIAVIAVSVALLVFPVWTANADTPECCREPVLLVHGWGMNSAITWPVMKSRLEAEGYTVYTHDFADNVGSNVQNAQELEVEIDRILAETGAEKVDIVAHSMGGLSTRYYIKYMGGCSKVEDVVEIGTPNHGTGFFLFAILKTPGDEEMAPGCTFLNDLNDGDETPGPVKWTSIRSRFDLIIIPYDSCQLEGARNLMVDWFFCGHLLMCYDQTVYGWVVEGLEGAGGN